MSAPPYMPLFVDDYEAATAHLSAEEDGVYNRLLRLCWRTPGCSIPNEPEWIARKIRLSAKDFERVARPVIAEFFKVARGRLYQKRQRQEWLKYADTKRHRQEAGRKGGIAKALKDKGKSHGSARRLLRQPEPEPTELVAPTGQTSSVRDAPILPPDGQSASAPEPYIKDLPKAERLAFAAAATAGLGLRRTH